ncbi:glycosyltransferase family 4 protein [Aliiroseovarius sp.]|uniref:glycosyltransferase family 4 protein n=1 Tax=Aliiroseovarius sp. TaxID=1872442 RepID=UPI003BABED32
MGYSEKTVFPSQFVSRAAEHHCDLDMSRTMVRGQGLLTDDFGTLDQQACRRLLREALGVEEDAFVVLNVGTIDMRKGADMFVDIAKLFFDGEAPSRPVYFIWHGAPDVHFHYAKDFIARHGLEDRVRLLPSTSQIEQVFLGGDLFLLTARADPFPCVIHEALACGLPVVAFRNGGGAPELIGDDCGAIIEMGHLPEAVAAIRSYLDAPDLLAEQGRAARRKIAQSWDYASYCADVYEVIRDSAKSVPPGGWPVLTPSAPEPHLIAMRGCLEDLAQLQTMGLAHLDQDCLVALIDGRFGEQADEVVAALRALGVRYHLCQPAEDTDAARATRLSAFLSNPRPKRVTFINTLQLLSPAQLRPLSIPKQAVVTGAGIGATALYARLTSLDHLYLTDPALGEKLIWMNPIARDIIRPIPETNPVSPTKRS